MTEQSTTTITTAYMEFRNSRCAPSTLQVDRTACKVLWGMGVNRLSELTIAHADKHVAKRKKDGVSPRTINMGVDGVKGIIKWAVGREKCPESQRLKRFLERKPETDHGVRPKKAFSLVEVHELLAQIPDTWLTLMQLYLCTGLRRCEGLFLRWSEVDLEAGLIRLPDSRTKTREPRDVYLGPRMVEILGKREQAGEYVFTNPATGSHYEVSTPKEVMRAAAERAGWSDLRGVSPHRCRHTFITVALQKAKITLQDVGKLAGHASNITGDTYYHPSDDHLKKEAAKVEALVLGGEEE